MDHLRKLLYSKATRSLTHQHVQSYTMLASELAALWLNLFDVAVKLFVANRQGGEELLKADRGPLLPGMRCSLDKTAIVVEAEPSAHLATFVAGQHTQVTVSTVITEHSTLQRGQLNAVNLSQAYSNLGEAHFR